MSNEVIGVIISLISFVLMGIIVYISNKRFEEKERQEALEKEERRKKELQVEMERRREESEKWNTKIQSKIDKSLVKTCYKPNKDLKIIVGDYNNWSASFTNSVLKGMGIDTFIVPTAYDIIDRINAGEKYDIIITNHIYYQGSGEEVLDTLKAQENFETPIIILTIDQNARNYYVGNLGFDEYIPKSLDSEKVMQVFPKVIKNLKFEKVKKQ